MRVFISWSGELSRSVAEILHDWLPSVIQTVEPFLSTDSIDKGSRWGAQLEDALGQSSFGIICLTRENLQSPWVTFEAGALSKGLGAGLVCPLLVDLEPQEVLGPLAEFQSTGINKGDMFKLVASLNRASGGQGIDQGRLSKLFEVIWPELEGAVNGALISNAKRSSTNEKEAPSSRTFRLLASRGTLVNPSDQSRNIAFKVETINLVFSDLAKALQEAVGVDAARAVFAGAGYKAAKTFGERIVEQWGLEYPDDDLSSLVDRWCTFDSDVGWGRLVNELVIDEESADVSGAIHLVDNFQTYKRANSGQVDCHLMHGYVEGVLESIFQGAPISVECDQSQCPLIHRMKKECVFRVRNS